MASRSCGGLAAQAPDGGDRAGRALLGHHGHARAWAARRRLLPFDKAFDEQNGAHVVASFDTSKVSRAQAGGDYAPAGCRGSGGPVRPDGARGSQGRASRPGGPAHGGGQGRTRGRGGPCPDRARALAGRSRRDRDQPAFRRLAQARSPGLEAQTPRGRGAHRRRLRHQHEPVRGGLGRARAADRVQAADHPDALPLHLRRDRGASCVRTWPASPRSCPGDRWTPPAPICPSRRPSPGRATTTCPS